MPCLPLLSEIADIRTGTKILKSHGKWKIFVFAEDTPRFSHALISYTYVTKPPLGEKPGGGCLSVFILKCDCVQLRVIICGRMLYRRASSF